MAKLTITDENGVDRLHELVDDVTTVGRSSSNVIKISDEKSSRNHFRIEKDGEFFKVIDLGSTNGTRLNGERVTSQRLRLGDVLSVGTTRFAYDGPGEPASPPPAPPPPVSAVTLPVPVPAPAPAPADGVTSALEGVAQPKYVLRVLEGSHAGKSYELGTQALTLGRHSQNSIALDDDAVSNYHAEIKKEPIGYILSDLGSTNGTRVRASGGKEFEKIVRTPLAVGMKVRIGKTVFEYLNIGAPSQDDAIMGTVVLDSDKLGNLIAERPAPRRRSGTGIGLAAGALALFAVTVWGVIQLLPEEHATGPLPPPPPPAPITGNQVKNGDFSQGTTDRGTPVGWEVNPGQPGIRVTVEPDGERNTSLAEDQRRGLVVYKGGTDLPSCRTTVESLDTYAVDPGQSYELSAALRNDGDGLYGLRLTWLGKDRSYTEHPVVLVASQEWKERAARLRPPAWAERVRVGVFSEGCQGKTYFDNLSFKLNSEAQVVLPLPVRFGGVTAEFLGTKGGFTCQSGGTLALDGGTLDLASRDEKVVSTLLSALDTQMTQEEGRVSFRGQMYDFVLQKLTNYSISAQAGAGGVEFRFAVDRQAENACDPQVRFQVCGPAARGGWEVFHENGSEKFGPLESKQLTDVREVLFNGGASPQLYLTFGTPVSLETHREGERRWVKILFRGELSLGVAPENVSQRQQLAERIKELERAWGESDWARTWRTADEIQRTYAGRFPEAEEAVRGARRKVDEAFRPVGEELKSQIDLMRQFKTAKVVREKIQSMLPPWAGTPHERDFKDALDQVAAIEKVGAGEEKENAARREMGRAQNAFNAGGGALQLCISLCKMILRDYKDTASAAPAQELLQRAETAKQEYDLLTGITDRLLLKVKAYLTAGEYAEAIRIVKLDPEYQKNAHKLEELKQKLEEWSRKAQEK